MINITQPISYSSPKFELSRQYYDTLDKLKEEDISLFPDYYITNVAGTLYQKNPTTDAWELYNPLTTDLIKSTNFIIGQTGSENITYQDYNIYLGTDYFNDNFIDYRGMWMSYSNNSDHYLSHYRVDNWKITQQIISNKQYEDTASIGGFVNNNKPYLELKTIDSSQKLLINQTNITYTSDLGNTMTLGFSDDETCIGDNIVYTTNGGFYDLSTITSGGSTGDYLPLAGGKLTGGLQAPGILVEPTDKTNYDIMLENGVISVPSIIHPDVDQQSDYKVFATSGNIVNLSGVSGNYLSLDKGGIVKGVSTFIGALQIGTPQASYDDLTNCLLFNNSSIEYGVELYLNSSASLMLARTNESSTSKVTSPLLTLGNTTIAPYQYIKANYSGDSDSNKVYATDGSIKDLNSYTQVQKQIQTLVNKATSNSKPSASDDELLRLQFTTTFITNENTAISGGMSEIANEQIYLRLPYINYLDYYELKSISIEIQIWQSSTKKYTKMYTVPLSTISEVNNYNYSTYNTALKISNDFYNSLTLSEGDEIIAHATYTFADLTIDTSAITYARRVVFAGENADGELEDPAWLYSDGTCVNNSIKPFAPLKRVVWRGSANMYAYISVPSEWTLPTGEEIQTYIVSGYEGTVTKYGCVKVGDFTISGTDALKSREYTTYRSTKPLSESGAITIKFN